RCAGLIDSNPFSSRTRAIPLSLNKRAQRINTCPTLPLFASSSSILSASNVHSFSTIQSLLHCNNNNTPQKQHKHKK
ncbi:MAG TPA: hypothetical protein DCE42_30715, partial [Myxococcales bacterium]|nr:hypothetical protein [Myxococcales bacterium]